MKKRARVTRHCDGQQREKRKRQRSQYPCAHSALRGECTDLSTNAEPLFNQGSGSLKNLDEIAPCLFLNKDR